ncbi:MAG: hypothetical protein ABF574_00855 [Gluconobacter japonicus]
MKIVHAVIRKLRPRARHPDGVREKRELIVRCALVPLQERIFPSLMSAPDSDAGCKEDFLSFLARSWEDHRIPYQRWQEAYEKSRSPGEPKLPDFPSKPPFSALRQSNGSTAASRQVPPDSQEERLEQRKCSQGLSLSSFGHFLTCIAKRIHRLSQRLFSQGKVAHSHYKTCRNCLNSSVSFPVCCGDCRLNESGCGCESVATKCGAA